MAQPTIFLVISIIISVIISSALALECYVCDHQESNQGKCTTTIKTCQQEEDVCLTEVKWGSTPYWTQGALKQHYISKKCSTKERCHRQRQSNMKYCTYVWYEDWRCSECCRGDRCNYYIFSSAGTFSSSKILLTLTLLWRIYKSL